MKNIETMMSYNEYLKTYFSLKLDNFIATYNLKCVDKEQRDVQLAEQALNLVAYVECNNGKGHIDALFQHYGNFCFLSGDYLFLILPYVDGVLSTAFIESKPEEVLDAWTIVKEVKNFRDRNFKNKKVMVYQVSFYSEANTSGHTGEFINDYGRFAYDIYLDANVSDEEPEDIEYV